MFEQPLYAEDLKQHVDLYCRDDQEGPNYMLAYLVTHPEFVVQFNPPKSTLLITRQGLYRPQIQVVVASRPTNGRSREKPL